MSVNRRIVLVERPTGAYAPENLRVEEVDCPPPGPGEILVRILYCSLAPMQRQRMSDVPSYVRPFNLGEVIASDVVGRVEASNSPMLSPGNLVIGRLGWQDFAVCDASSVEKIDDDDPVLWLGMLGSPGLTAYMALIGLGHPAPAETVVVTSAAGAVGSYACQLASLCGARVVGIVGTNSKLETARSYGCSAVVSYKDPNFGVQLANAVPGGIDVVFDLVGGTTADTAFSQLARGARVVLCGRLASNNSTNPSEDFVNLRSIWLKEATLTAFSLYSHKERFSETRQKLLALYQSGLIQPSENVIQGLENIPRAFSQFLEGHYSGRVVVKV